MRIFSILLKVQEQLAYNNELISLAFGQNKNRKCSLNSLGDFGYDVMGVVQVLNGIVSLIHPASLSEKEENDEIKNWIKTGKIKSIPLTEWTHYFLKNSMISNNLFWLLINCSQSDPRVIKDIFGELSMLKPSNFEGINRLLINKNINNFANLNKYIDNKKIEDDWFIAVRESLRESAILNIKRPSILPSDRLLFCYQQNKPFSQFVDSLEDAESFIYILSCLINSSEGQNANEVYNLMYQRYDTGKALKLILNNLGVPQNVFLNFLDASQSPRSKTDLLKLLREKRIRSIDLLALSEPKAELLDYVRIKEIHPIEQKEPLTKEEAREEIRTSIEKEGKIFLLLRGHETLLDEGNGSKLTDIVYTCFLNNELFSSLLKKVSDYSKYVTNYTILDLMRASAEVTKKGCDGQLEVSQFFDSKNMKSYNNMPAWDVIQKYCTTFDIPMNMFITLLNLSQTEHSFIHELIGEMRTQRLTLQDLKMDFPYLYPDYDKEKFKERLMDKSINSTEINTNLTYNWDKFKNYELQKLYFFRTIDKLQKLFKQAEKTVYSDKFKTANEMPFNQFVEQIPMWESFLQENLIPMFKIYDNATEERNVNIQEYFKKDTTTTKQVLDFCTKTYGIPENLFDIFLSMHHKEYCVYFAKDLITFLRSKEMTINQFYKYYTLNNTEAFMQNNGNEKGLVMPLQEMNPSIVRPLSPVDTMANQAQLELQNENDVTIQESNELNELNDSILANLENENISADDSNQKELDMLNLVLQARYFINNNQASLELITHLIYAIEVYHRYSNNWRFLELNSQMSLQDIFNGEKYGIEQGIGARNFLEVFLAETLKINDRKSGREIVSQEEYNKRVERYLDEESTTNQSLNAINQYIANNTGISFDVLRVLFDCEILFNHESFGMDSNQSFIKYFMQKIYSKPENHDNLIVMYDHLRENDSNEDYIVNLPNELDINSQNKAVSRIYAENLDIEKIAGYGIHCLNLVHSMYEAKTLYSILNSTEPFLFDANEKLSVARGRGLITFCALCYGEKYQFDINAYDLTEKEEALTQQVQTILNCTPFSQIINMLSKDLSISPLALWSYCNVVIMNCEEESAWVSKKMIRYLAILASNNETAQMYDNEVLKAMEKLEYGHVFLDKFVMPKSNIYTDNILNNCIKSLCDAKEHIPNEHKDILKFDFIHGNQSFGQVKELISPFTFAKISYVYDFYIDLILNSQKSNLIVNKDQWSKKYRAQKSISECSKLICDNFQISPLVFLNILYVSTNKELAAEFDRQFMIHIVGNPVLMEKLTSGLEAYYPNEINRMDEANINNFLKDIMSIQQLLTGEWSNLRTIDFFRDTRRFSEVLASLSDSESASLRHAYFVLSKAVVGIYYRSNSEKYSGKLLNGEQLPLSEYSQCICTNLNISPNLLVQLIYTDLVNSYQYIKWGKESNELVDFFNLIYFKPSALQECERRLAVGHPYANRQIENGANPNYNFKYNIISNDDMDYAVEERQLSNAQTPDFSNILNENDSDEETMKKMIDNINDFLNISKYNPNSNEQTECLYHIFLRISQLVTNKSSKEREIDVTALVDSYCSLKEIFEEFEYNKVSGSETFLSVLQVKGAHNIRGFRNEPFKDIMPSVLKNSQMPNPILCMIFTTLVSPEIMQNPQALKAISDMMGKLTSITKTQWDALAPQFQNQEFLFGVQIGNGVNHQQIQVSETNSASVQQQPKSTQNESQQNNGMIDQQIVNDQNNSQPTVMPQNQNERVPASVVQLAKELDHTVKKVSSNANLAVLPEAEAQELSAQIPSNDQQNQNDKIQQVRSSTTFDQLTQQNQSNRQNLPVQPMANNQQNPVQAQLQLTNGQNHHKQ